MAQFSINLGAYVNQSPTQIGDLTLNIDYGESYVFTVNNFTIDTTPQYSDPDGDPAYELKILIPPTTGQLLLNGVPLLADDTVLFSDIANGLLIFQADTGTTTAYTDSFTFDIADTGSQSYSGLSGTITFNVAEKENEPPSVVGDGEATINYGETLVFTSEMLTILTTPPYQDPEGDPAAQLKVTTLPVLGLLKLNGTNVVLNQIIQFTDIAAGNFTYVPDLVNKDEDLQLFTFEIADSGSGQFTS